MGKSNNYISEYEAIVETVQYYIDGSREGKSDLMHSSFLDHATIIGHFGGSLVSGPIQILYDLIDKNGPVPDIQPHFASIEIVGTMAVVRLEIYHWSGNVIGSDTHMSDLFNLIKTDEGWKISQKMFHVNVH